MKDLKDGASAEVQGSARNPYVLKNVDGVYSCSCPAWVLDLPTKQAGLVSCRFGGK